MVQIKKISIITVCFNAEDTISKTIESVLEQTYDYIEYIIIDGNSSDNTVRLIKEYESEITKRGYDFVFLSEKDSGIYDAMNKGILLSTGEWIHFRNSGDYFFNSQVIESLFCKEINPLTEIIYGDARFWDEFGYCDMKPSILFKSYKESMPFFHPSTFVKTILHKALLFDTTYKLSSDYDFFFKCCELNIHSQYFPIVVAMVNVNDGASIRNRLSGLKENIKIRGLDHNLSHKIHLKYIEVFMLFRKYMKKILPKKYIYNNQLKNRKKNGWIIQK